MMALAALVVTAAPACQVDRGADVVATTSPIIGGLADPSPGDAAVVAVATLDGDCTGILVAPHTVLTSAHCVVLSATLAQPGTVSFGSGPDRVIATRVITEVAMHPAYQDAGVDADLAALRLDQAAPQSAAPLAVNSALLGQSLVGFPLRAVGFGVDDPAQQSGQGEKRVTALVVTAIAAGHVLAGDDVHATCQGDSGGPLLLVIDGVETIVAVISRGPADCAGPSLATRVDPHVAGFVRPIVAAWDAACADLDGCAPPAQGCAIGLDPRRRPGVGGLFLVLALLFCAWRAGTSRSSTKGVRLARAGFGLTTPTPRAGLRRTSGLSRRGTLPIWSSSTITPRQMALPHVHGSASSGSKA